MQMNVGAVPAGANAAAGLGDSALQAHGQARPPVLVDEVLDLLHGEAVVLDAEPHGHPEPPADLGAAPKARKQPVYPACAHSIRAHMQLGKAVLCATAKPGVLDELANGAGIPELVLEEFQPLRDLAPLEQEVDEHAHALVAHAIAAGVDARERLPLQPAETLYALPRAP